MIEYGIVKASNNEFWRGPYENVWEVQYWLNEWIEDGGDPTIFALVTREVSEWSRVDKST